MEEQPPASGSGEGLLPSPMPSPPQETNITWKDGYQSRPGKKRKYPVCQVCSMPLRDERPYYQRYRICRRCASKDRTDTDGILNRFCQQCAKFQAVDLFDGNMKTCRQRLDRHAARRRKANIRTSTPSGLVFAIGPAQSQSHHLGEDSTMPPTSLPLPFDIAALGASHFMAGSGGGDGGGSGGGNTLLEMMQNIMTASSALLQHNPMVQTAVTINAEHRWREQQHQLLASLTGTPPSPSSITNPLYHPVALRFNPSNKDRSSVNHSHKIHDRNKARAIYHGRNNGTEDTKVDPEAARAKLEAAIEALQVPPPPSVLMNAWNLAVAQSSLPSTLGFLGNLNGMLIGGGGGGGGGGGSNNINNGNTNAPMQQFGEVLRAFFTQMSGVDGSSAAQATAAVPEQQPHVMKKEGEEDDNRDEVAIEEEGGETEGDVVRLQGGQGEEEEIFPSIFNSKVHLLR